MNINNGLPTYQACTPDTVSLTMEETQMPSIQNGSADDVTENHSLGSVRAANTSILTRAPQLVGLVPKITTAGFLLGGQVFGIWASYKRSPSDIGDSIGGVNRTIDSLETDALDALEILELYRTAYSLMLGSFGLGYITYLHFKKKLREREVNQFPPR